MNNTLKSTTLLSLLSKVFTAAVVLLLTTFTYARPQYVITVVNEAWVSTQSTEPVGPPMSCKTEQSISKAVAKMTWQYSPDYKPEKILELSKTETVYATRHTEEPYLQLATLWLAVKTGTKTQYYPMTELNMYEDKLPSVDVSGRTLTVKDNIFSVDPTGDNEILQVPNVEEELYQTIRIGQSRNNELGLSKLSCVR